MNTLATCDGVRWASPSPAHLGLVRSSSEIEFHESNEHQNIPSRNRVNDFFEFTDVLIETGAIQFGRALYEATTIGQITNCLDALSGNESFLKFHEYICHLALPHWRPMTEYRLRRRLAVLTGKGHDDSQVLELAHVLQIAETATAFVLRQEIPAPAIPPTSLYLLMEHIATPAEYVAAMRGALRSAAAQMGLLFGHLERRKNRTDDAGWHDKALLDFAIEGQRRYLRLLAGMPGTRVPEEVVSIDERVAWLPLVNKWNELLRGISEVKVSAARRGQSVYFPFEEPPDE